MHAHKRGGCMRELVCVCVYVAMTLWVRDHLHL